MKSFFFILMFSPLLYAQVQTPPPIAEQYRWLYEILLNQNDRVNEPNESFKSFYVHLHDSYEFFPYPSEIQDRNLRLVDKIEGKIGYLNNAVKKRYAYDVLKAEQNSFVINVRIHLKDPVGEDFNNFAEKIKMAEVIWNNSRIQFDFKYQFKFELVTEAEKSHYSVNVFDQTRGPYDLNWSRSWKAVTIAHEIGHMMGLADEYQTLSGKVDCLKKSLMCASNSGELMQHHYYFILRRLVNTPLP